MSIMKDHLLDLPLFRWTDPETSREAAKKVQPRRGSQAMQILALYANRDLTDEKAVELSGLNGGWKRCSDLRRLGLIAFAGYYGKTESGCNAMVCSITMAGMEALA